MSTSVTLHWSAEPGNFLNKNTGESIKVYLEQHGRADGPIFTGDQNEWNETLIETVIDTRNQLQRALAGQGFPGTVVSHDVYASPNTIKLFATTVLCKPSKNPYPSVYDFRMFEVFEDPSYADEDIRVELMLNVNGTNVFCNGSVKVHDIK